MTTDGPSESAAVLRQQLADLHRQTYSWALNCCDRNRADAEDVLQTTYLKVLDGRARFDGRSSFLTWLFAIVRRTAADRRRRSYLHSLLLGPVIIEGADSEVQESVEVGFERSQQHSRLLAALASLSRRQREVVNLVFYHDLTVEQAAQIMSVSLGSARQHYARGKQRLRALLDDAAGPR